MEKAIFAGGCFWCMVEPFDSLPGIEKVVSGYTGGTTKHPTYQDVKYGGHGHVEAVEITFDSTVMPYEKLLDMFWRQIDPTDDGGQFADRGKSYQTAIFYTTSEQKKKAQQSKKALEKSNIFSKRIVTPIVKAKPFYPAETEHQDFYKKNPYHYKQYKKGSGRSEFLNNTWVKPSKNQLRNKLTPMQFYVTQENGTEPAFDNEYYNNDQEGIYVDLISGEVLFTTNEQYDAGCGWPSFTKPVKRMDEKSDLSHGMRRVEIRSPSSDAHLGHVFDDGPKESGGLRYCINSASLRFIPKDDLEDEGYGEYRRLFD